MSNQVNFMAVATANQAIQVAIAEFVAKQVKAGKTVRWSTKGVPKGFSAWYSPMVKLDLLRAKARADAQAGRPSGWCESCNQHYALYFLTWVEPAGTLAPNYWLCKDCHKPASK